MSLDKISDQDWFSQNPNRMYRLRDRERSDPRVCGFWPFGKVSNYVIVRRNWGGRISVLNMPMSFDSKPKSEKLLISQYDSVLCEYFNRLNPRPSVNQKARNSIWIEIAEVIRVFKLSRGKK